MKIKTNNYYFPKYSLLVLMGLLVILFFIYGFDTILFLRPQSVHQWRQCDCLSFTLNFYHNDGSFFAPVIHYLGRDGDGKTVSDFPLLYYGIGKLWKITGYHEYIYRLIVLLISFAGLAALAKTVEGILKDSFMGLFMALILYSSTIFVYYSNNFLMNVPAFSFALIGLFFFYKFYDSGKNKFLFISMLFFLTGGLLKTPGLMGFVAILGIFVIEQIFPVRFGKNGKLFPRPKIQILPFLIVIILIALWYWYAASYNSRHNSGIFLIGILPIWEINKAHILDIIHSVRILWLSSYQSKVMQGIAIVLFIAVLFSYKKSQKFLWYFMALLGIGFLLYLLLFFQVFNHHDYYLINQLIFMLSIFTSFFYLLKLHCPRVFKSWIFRVLLVLLMVYNVNVCARNIYNRYHVNWLNPYLTETKGLDNIDNITPYLRSLGIKRTDPMLVEQDPSFDITLYFMDQKGYTTFGGRFRDSLEIRQGIKSDLKYMIVTDSSLLQQPYLQPFIKDRIGRWGKFYIFKLH